MRLLFFLAALVLALTTSACQAAGAAPGVIPESPDGLVTATTPVSGTSLPTIPQKPAPTSTAFPVTGPTATQLPTPTVTVSPSPTIPICLPAGGRIDHHSITNDLALLSWEFRVYTPPCYDEEPDRHYPLLILIHGQTYDDDQWDRLGVDETADRLISEGAIPPIIILMPRDRRWVDPPKDRFGEALTDYLIPWMDENYRTIPDRQYRAIGGLSRGASWAVHLGITRWDLFGAFGAHSLPVFWSDNPRVHRWLQEIPAESLPRIYVDIGEGDYLIDSAVWFEGVLAELNIPHTWHLFPGKHEEAYWMSHVEDYLRWYTAGW